MKNNILNEIILRNWGGIILNAKIDEDLKDVKLMIKYSDRGDDFLVVKTENETYEYGWWLYRNGQPDYNDLIKLPIDYGFIRKPKLYFAADTKSNLANEIYFYILRNFYNTGFFVVDTIRKECNQLYAQIKFDGFIEFMADIANRRITYDETDGTRKKVEDYLKCNEILTPENIAKLDAVKWTSRIDGIDGFAGKKLYRSSRLHGDKIEFIYYKGEFQNVDTLEMDYDRDDWGFEMFDLSLKQFE